MIKMITTQRRIYSAALFYMMVLSSAYIDYEYYNFFKLILLAISSTILLVFWKRESFSNALKFKLFLLYSIFLVVFFLREIDSYSLRIVFNLLVTIVCSAAFLLVGVYKLDLKIGLLFVFAFFVYNYIFNINLYDGKPQAHAQVFTLVTLAMVLIPLVKNRIAYFLLLAIVLVSQVRSVLLGFLPVMIIRILNLSRRITVFAHMFVVFSAAFGFYYLSVNLDLMQEIFGSSLNSLNWRFYHWNNLFNDFSGVQWIFGEGLGYSWRITLYIEDFYTDGINYVASHSNYVKIVTESGLVGLLVYCVFMFVCYINSSTIPRALIVFYISYGFYDEGVWLYSMFWTLLLTYEKVLSDD
ncbi:O-antigen ligase family protein [Rheinheimera texasensis]|uniref:O-antigen ligase family protein n=1 Tax=Rheinheimera texasensis TaxID=306205 RepID=UPI0032B26706